MEYDLFERRMGIWILVLAVIAWAAAQLIKLLGVYRAGGFGHELAGVLHLGEGHHVPQGGGAQHLHDQTVQADTHAAVGRRAVLVGVHQKAKALARLSSVKPSAWNMRSCRAGALMASSSE